MPRRKKRTYGSGSVRPRSVERKDGSVRTYWEARFSDGRDPKTGKVIQRTITGPTCKIVQEKLTKALAERIDGTYVPPSNQTVAQWLETWSKDYLLASRIPPRCSTASRSGSILSRTSAPSGWTS